MNLDKNNIKMSISLTPLYTGLLYLFGLLLLLANHLFGWGLAWYVLVIPFAIPFIGAALGLSICLVIALCVFLMTCVTLILGAVEDCVWKFKK